MVFKFNLLNRDCKMSLTDYRDARCLGSLYAGVILHWLSTNNSVKIKFKDYHSDVTCVKVLFNEIIEE